MIWVWCLLLEQIGHSEVITAVPVQKLPHPCEVTGFPLVLEKSVLGCDRSGIPNQLWDVELNQVRTVPSATWAMGNELFATGRNGGRWDLNQADWYQPKRRVLDDVGAESVRIQDSHVLWVTNQSVHVLDLETGLARERKATPVVGQPPVWLDGSVAWIEWGAQPSIQVWTIDSDAILEIPATLPTQLYNSKKDLYWIDTVGVQHWNTADKDVRTVQTGLIQDIWVSDAHLCWSQVHADDVDVWCDGIRWEREGGQRYPRIQPWGRTFVENGLLMMILD